MGEGLRRLERIYPHALSRWLPGFDGRSMTTLTAHTLTVRRKDHLALNNVSFSARGGDFVALLGPSGMAKSILLSALAGVISPSTGSVTLNGVPLTWLGSETLGRHRAYLARNVRHEEILPVERFIALGITSTPRSFNAVPESFRPHIDSVLDLCDLTPKRLQAMITLSRGELARARLARALVNNPGVLIADDPTTGLMARDAVKVASCLRVLADKGKLVIAAMCGAPLLARYATRVITLRRGRIDDEVQRSRRPREPVNALERPP